MKVIIDGYDKSIHKYMKKNEILDSIKASSVNDITLIGKGYVTFDVGI